MHDLENARKEIDRIDREMERLFEERMAAAAVIAQYKKERGLPIRDPEREAALTARNVGLLRDPALEGDYRRFLRGVIDRSCDYQARLMDPERSAAVTVAPGALTRVDRFFDLERRVMVVTDDGVPAAYAEGVAARCRRAQVFTFPQGEASKSWEQLRELLRAMVEADMTRQDAVVAVGGGVVSDLAGLAASLYMRGIDFYAVPTTLLAQVDASVGGKTAVDLEGVKNPVGAFYPAQSVLIDTDTLATLPPRLLRAGLAEAVKMAATCDEALFRLLETAEDLLGQLPEIVRRAVEIKRRVVEADPREQGLRRVLNFGHTLGHALESAADGSLLHGECVALGMLPMAQGETRQRLEALLERLGLPTTAPYGAEQLLPFLTHDKKRQRDRIRTVQTDRIGQFLFADETPGEIAARWEAVR